MYKFITLFALLGFIVILSGCAALFSEQEWSRKLFPYGRDTGDKPSDD